MKQKNIILSVIAGVTIGLTGCSGSGGSSNSLGNNSIASTDITVERGAVYDANVTDADGQKANKNVYTFATTPNYPITVIDGWVDVDNDGKKTIEDITLEKPMFSYTNVVTPITTYIADTNDSIREQRLADLETMLNISKEELLKIPSEASTDAMLAHNAVFYELISRNNTASLVDINNVKTKFSELNTTASQSPGKSAEELLVLIEKDIVSLLIIEDKVKYIKLEDADMTNSAKDEYILKQKDFLIENTISNFSSITNAELSTEYISDEWTITGIDTQMKLSISNSDFKIVKNSVAVDESSVLVSNGDTIQLKTTSSDSFEDTKSVSLSIANVFTQELSERYSYEDAKGSCNAAAMDLPLSTDIVNNEFDSNLYTFKNYWASDTAVNGLRTTVDITTDIVSSESTSLLRGVVCTKNYTPITFSVTTKVDTNQAPIANAGADMKVYYTDSVTFDGTSSSDDNGIISYEWKNGNTLLSNVSTFVKDDLAVATHTITLKVTDDAGKNSIDCI